MWLGKFLDLKDDLKELTSELKSEIFEAIKKNKLTPLEFTILETIFNKKEIHGYDLIDTLNQHFAGTWEARSGTVYPILSKLKRDGFLRTNQIKSPLGPIQKVYGLTEAGKKIIKRKVNQNFLDQLSFMQNFIIELASLYLKTLPENGLEEKRAEVYDLIEGAFENIKGSFSLKGEFKKNCANCNAEIVRRGSAYCSFCGSSLILNEEE